MLKAAKLCDHWRRFEGGQPAAWADLPEGVRKRLKGVSRAMARLGTAVNAELGR